MLSTRCWLWKDELGVLEDKFQHLGVWLSALNSLSLRGRCCPFLGLSLLVCVMGGLDSWPFLSPQASKRLLAPMEKTPLPGSLLCVTLWTPRAPRLSSQSWRRSIPRQLRRLIQPVLPAQPGGCPGLALHCSSGTLEARGRKLRLTGTREVTEVSRE